MKKRKEGKKEGKKRKRIKNYFALYGISDFKGRAAYKSKAACTYTELPSNAELNVKAELPTRMKLPTKAGQFTKGSLCNNLRENLYNHVHHYHCNFNYHTKQNPSFWFL